ncbi:hypothetical protein B0H14DRAFT_2614087 [Mycena olivaceomarginata]|nr:hypothetical protein B0H14DRAFT_2614087 [Mycena olivaceomarginata]
MAWELRSPRLCPRRWKRPELAEPGVNTTSESKPAQPHIFYGELSGVWLDDQGSYRNSKETDLLRSMLAIEEKRPQWDQISFDATMERQSGSCAVHDYVLGVGRRPELAETETPQSKGSYRNSKETDLLRIMLAIEEKCPQWDQISFDVTMERRLLNKETDLLRFMLAIREKCPQWDQISFDATMESEWFGSGRNSQSPG